MTARDTETADTAETPEISDLIVSYDPETHARRPVARASIVELFLARGNRRAAGIVAELPARDGILDEPSVDRLLIRVHAELQRLSEEFQHGPRVAELLRPLLAALREADVPRPIRIVDIGCGTGFVVRWLAARGSLGHDVEVVGTDFNLALVEEARRLAAAEAIPAQFVAADAFRLAEPASIYITTGVIHHFRGPDLAELFRAHDRSRAEAFFHFDFQPSPFAPLGARLFHAARMREPLSKHDGVLSAVRAHSGETLLASAREGARGFDVALYGRRFGGLPIPRTFLTVLGVRPVHRLAFVRHLGGRAGRLESFR